jgi:hypothetical protein
VKKHLYTKQELQQLLRPETPLHASELDGLKKSPISHLFKHPACCCLALHSTFFIFLAFCCSSLPTCAVRPQTVLSRSIVPVGMFCWSQNRHKQINNNHFQPNTLISAHIGRGQPF